MAQNSKRGRGRSRRQGGGNNPNRSIDSQGPEVKIRGTAQQVYDKYTALARDAFSSGDRIRGESLQQHAEHYYRMLQSMLPKEQRDGYEAPQQNGQQDPAQAGGGQTGQSQAGQSQTGQNNEQNGDRGDQDARGGQDRDEGQADQQATVQERPRRPRRAKEPSDREAVEKDAPAAVQADKPNGSIDEGDDDAPRARRSRRRRTRKPDDEGGAGEEQRSGSSPEEAPAA